MIVFFRNIFLCCVLVWGCQNIYVIWPTLRSTLFRSHTGIDSCCMNFSRRIWQVSLFQFCFHLFFLIMFYGWSLQLISYCFRFGQDWDKMLRSEEDLVTYVSFSHINSSSYSFSYSCGRNLYKISDTSSTVSQGWGKLCCGAMIS